MVGSPVVPLSLNALPLCSRGRRDWAVGIGQGREGTQEWTSAAVRVRAPSFVPTLLTTTYPLHRSSGRLRAAGAGACKSEWTGGASGTLGISPTRIWEDITGARQGRRPEAPLAGIRVQQGERPCRRTRNKESQAVLHACRFQLRGSTCSALTTARGGKVTLLATAAEHQRSLFKRLGTAGVWTPGPPQKA